MEALLAPVRFEAMGEIIEVPASFISDGGSVPWFARWLVNPSHHRRAWIIHDWAWETQRADHADLLNAALIADDCPWFQRLVIVCGVKLFGASKRRNPLP